MAVRRDEVNLQVTIGAAQAGNTLRDLKKEARDLRRSLERIPVGTKEFDDARSKLKQVTDQIAEAEGKVKGMSRELQAAGQATGFWKNALSTALGVFGGFSLDNIIGSLAAYGQNIFDIGTQLDNTRAKTSTVFGEAESIVQGFAQANARELGLAQQEYVNLATSAGDLLKPMGFTEQAVADLSVQLTDQAGILAEWSQGRFTANEASEILTKALLGERDALNSLGVDVKDSLIQDELKQRGLQGLTGEARRQAEALITLQLVTEQSASANEAFAKNTDSAARNKARLRATVAELTQQLASAFVPVVNVAVSLLLKAAEFAIGFGKALVAIPAFLNENKVGLGLLATALLSFNAASIAAAANTLRQAAAQKAASIATAAQAAAQRALNLVLAANPIGLVVTALAFLAGVFVTAYQNSETFRRVVQGSFEAVKGYVLNTLSIFRDFGQGLSSFFTGNFDDAAKAFGSAFQKINPLEVGRQLKAAFVSGYNSLPAPTAEVNVDEKKAEEAGAKVGSTLGKGLDNAFENLNSKTANSLSSAAQKGLEARLKEIEVGYLKEELVLDRALFNQEMSESDHAKRILELKELQYTQQLEAFKRFNQAESREALQAQKALLEVQQQRTRPTETPVATLGARPQRGVQSQFGGIETKATVQTLRDKYVQILAVEQEGELARLDFQREVLARRLELLEEAGLTETEEYKNTLKQKEEADAQYAERKAQLEEDTAQRIIRQQEALVGAAEDAFAVAIDLLSKDEAARKKNGAAIKALNIAQVTVSGIAEVQKIWANAAELGPIVGPIVGAIQTAVAIGRSVAAISKIQSQKFAMGGIAKLGFFGGRPHSAGGTKGYFEDGTMLEVEAGEAFAVVNKRNAPLLRALSAINSAGGNGVPFFAQGGLVKLAAGGLPTFSTTPAAFSTPATAAQPILANIGGFVDAVGRFERTVSAFPTEVKSRVVYTELQDTAAQVAAVQSEASL